VRLGLFAGGDVGLAVASAVVDRGHQIACLVVANGAPSALRDLGSHSLVEAVLRPEDVTAARLRALRLDLGLLAWWPSIVAPEVLAAVSGGFLNLHPSLLPNQRGKDPNFWAIRERTPFGVTIHHVDAGIDTGDVAFQRPIEVTWEDTGGTLYAKALEAMVQLVEDNLDVILAGDAPRTPQGAGGSFHRRAELDPASQIDLDATYTARDLLDLLRARTFAGYPAASFLEGDDRYEVRVEITRVRPRAGSA
jgi:methionyl-tRNA formyltransferase